MKDTNRRMVHHNGIFEDEPRRFCISRDVLPDDGRLIRAMSTNKLPTLNPSYLTSELRAESMAFTFYSKKLQLLKAGSKQGT